ncbi:MAG: hypothetical protein ACI90X_000070 [Oceanospirillaceae bacterium]|jgi:hypothetical protein|tara:strand:+ start:366 stop:518 length:153 start_codon:yes stop_codon:yes gene_type:complete
MEKLFISQLTGAMQLVFTAFYKKKYDGFVFDECMASWLLSLMRAMSISFV